MTQPPALTHVADLSVEVGPPIVLGQTADGLRRVIPILGGRMHGPRLDGTILAAGADYQLVRPDGLAEIDARYVVRLDDGELLYVVAIGVRHAAPELVARLSRGEAVDPGLVYFRTTLRFEASAQAYRHLTRRLYLATGARHPDRVEMGVFEVG